MPMILGGSGTISGLAVGGLPAGTVNAASFAAGSIGTTALADSSITTAKIVDNTVAAGDLASSLNLSGKALTGLTLLSGTWTTSSDRNPGGSWTDHIASSSFTVPTGCSATVVAVAGSHGCYESGAGQGSGRIQVRGPATYTGSECWWNRGFVNHYADGGGVGYTVTVPEGTWTVYFQVVTINGTFISNYYTAMDYLTATAIQVG